MRIASNLHIPCIALTTLLIVHFSSGAADAAIACYQCHGTTSPADYRPIDADHRDISTGGFVGNHRTHMGASATASSCATCHPGSGAYTSSHRDGRIKIASRTNDSPLVTAYRNSTSAFPQTSTPVPGACANVNCHFETITPGWGNNPATTACNTCHGAPPSGTSGVSYAGGAAGSHSKHDATYSGTSHCIKCHSDHTADPKPFAHATSAGKRGLVVQPRTPSNVISGNYVAPFTPITTVLPSQAAAHKSKFGTCQSTYCHGTTMSQAGDRNGGTNIVPAWDTATTGQCGTCHGADGATPPLRGSHRSHVGGQWYYPPGGINDYIHGRLMPCSVCHKGYTAKHVNGSADWSFDSATKPWLSGARYRALSSGAVSPVLSASYGQCTNLYCHSIIQTSSGGPLTGQAGEYKSPTWGNLNEGKCGGCHGADIQHSMMKDGFANPFSGYTAQQMKSGSHRKHLSALSAGSDFGPSGAAATCSACHNYVGTDNFSSCANLCHNNQNSLHVNHQIDILFPPKYAGSGVAYNGSLVPGSGFSGCSNTYCHSNGTSVATGAVPANTTPNWGSGALACNACHGNTIYSDDRKALPLYTTGKPKANSHSIHAIHSVTDCSICHYGTTTTGNTITDLTKHVNKAYDLQAKPGFTFTYVYNSAGGSCSTVSCHANAQWGGGGAGMTCIDCHGHSAGYEYEPGKFSQGKGSWKVHASHTQNDGGNVKGPNLACNACHDTNNFPYFKSGTDSNSDGKYSLAETDVCDTCHSPGGAYDGVSDATIGARNNWTLGVYDGNALKAGKENWCLGCHDSVPAVINAQTATNKAGNGTTYGYNITGHGRSSTFPRMSWQDTTASGNPAAGRGCIDCHDSTKSHINTGASNSRLIAGYENENNANCYQCHKSGSMANNAPVFYTTTSAYRASAHKNKLCSECHDVHGSTGAYAAMTKGDKEGLCYQCHKDPASGGIQNNAVSGASLATSIQSAFGMTTKHALGTSFANNGKDYSLQCASCHNVHVVTGKYWDADSGKSPVSRFTNNTTVWGARSGQKMVDYAGTGKYQKPMVTANTYDSANLPDYNTFCLDCHSSSVAGISAKDWTNDPHGKKVAGLSGMISGGGVTGAVYAGPKDCPDWKGCGRAFDWGQDRCSPSGSNNDCWPVVPRGSGTNAYVKGGYSQEERNSGVNYVLSCTDCHEAHGSDKYKLLRTALNRDSDVADEPLTNDRKVWDDSQGGSVGLCMQCHNPKNTREHSFNPGWHNDGTCGTGPCHQPPTTGHPPFGHDQCYGRCHSSTYIWNTDLMNDPSQWGTFHENRQKGTSPQLAPSHVPGLVTHYKFENNLKDSNTWNLHGISFNGAVSYVAGKVGNAVVLSDRPIEAGTEEHQWGSTAYESGGPHGNASKFTEMKYNTTVETWVYPTSNPSDGYERKVLAKHNYWEGGYALVLKPVNGQYRAGFIANVDYGGPTTGWDSTGCNGLRGAYSNQSIPLNQWTHIAATFDTSGPDGTSGDLSVGRIRIYVNGHDVTTSETPTVSTNCWVEPKAGETAMTPYTEFTARWPAFSGFLATALSVGGLNWSAPNDNFIGRLDEVKLWNITKPVSYFDAINAADPPRIASAVKGSAPNQLVVTFNEGAYANNDRTGDLQPSDFVFTDADNGRTITAVAHTAGSSTATLTLSSALDYSDDFGVDTVAAVSNSIFDDQGAAMGTDAVTTSGDDGVAPTIVSAVVIGANKITVTFSEGVYTNTGATANLVPADFVYTDADNGRSITNVSHTAGSSTAQLTLSANLDGSGDIGVDTVAAASNAIYDDLSRTMGTSAVAISGNLCPPVPVTFQLNEASGSTTVTDDQGFVIGTVVGGNSFQGDGYYHGSGTVSNYIYFDNYDTCMQASTALTLEALIKPANIVTNNTTSYTGRVFAKRNTTGNEERNQMTVWRGLTATYPAYTPVANVASIALWLKPNDAHGGNAYKPILTEATNITGSPDNYCPIVSDHWYLVKAVFDSNKAGGTPGAYFVPGNIYVEDRGTDGLGAGKNWTGLLDCTDTDQSQLPNNYKLWTGDTISAAVGRFVIGANKDLTGNFFNGLIDWIKWKDTAD